MASTTSFNVIFLPDFASLTPPLGPFIDSMRSAAVNSCRIFVKKWNEISSFSLNALIDTYPSLDIDAR